MCNKKYFRDKKTAKKKAKELWQVYNQKYEVYTCNECWEIHLTKKKSVEEKIYFRNNKKLWEK